MIKGYAVNFTYKKVKGAATDGYDVSVGTSEGAAPSQVIVFIHVCHCSRGALTSRRLGRYKSVPVLHSGNLGNKHLHMVATSQKAL